jgi:type 1 glutamine amidotransferase
MEQAPDPKSWGLCRGRPRSVLLPSCSILTTSACMTNFDLMQNCTPISLRLSRREMLVRSGAMALGLTLAGWTSAGRAQAKPRRVLFFSKSSGFEHPVIKRKGEELSFAEKILAELGPKQGIEFTFSKDGSLFTPESLAKFDAYFFYTTGDLTAEGTDKNPPMSKAGKAALLEAIRNGKGFIGTHSATDTFHTNENSENDTRDRSARYRNYGDKADPYVQMIGAEFIKHGAQQKATMRVADQNFPGLKSAGGSFELHEEWYSLKDFAKDLHVILVNETSTMTGNEYQRPAFPATWARMHGKGRVFYTSMGHREDVWTNPLFQEILFGGIAWAVGNREADVTPNLKKAAPGHAELPPQTASEPRKAAKEERKKS